jgi:hypothetical protein
MQIEVGVSHNQTPLIWGDKGRKLDYREQDRDLDSRSVLVPYYRCNCGFNGSHHYTSFLS